MIVTISGRPGSGKSAVAGRVASALGIEHVSAGDFMREMASERGMTILELSRLAEDGDAIDREIDARTMKLARGGGSFVMDARLGWHFVPNSFKVFLDVRPEVAAQRIYNAQRGSEKENISLEDTLTAIELRTESERMRYLMYYDLDYTDHTRYNLVVDTSNRTLDQVVDLVLAGIDDARSGVSDDVR